MDLHLRIDKLLNLKQSSRISLAKLLGIPQTTFNRYFKRENQSSLAPHLWTIAEIFPDVRRDWLFFGEGEPFSDRQSPIPDVPLVKSVPTAPTSAVAPVPPPVAGVPSAIPITGFASCGINGWNGCMTYPLAVPVPHMRQGMLAVMASGESMLPEGIGHGHVCFCDPHATPIAGECVYVAHRDNMATLKAFVGTVQMGGGMGYRLKGWMDKTDDTPQKHFYLDVLQEMVVTLAPVVYVQRRL